MTVVNTSLPVVSGTARQGQTLVTTSGAWTFDLDYLTYAYQWLRCDSAGANCVDIAGATAASYLVQAADVGSRIRAEVTATEASYPISGELTWSPPTAGAGGVSVVNFTLTNATRTSSTLGAGAGRDLVIDNTEVLTGPVAQMTGWRHIIWIGGEMNISADIGKVTGVAVRNITGIVHLEGVWLHGTNGPHDCFVIRSAETTEGCIIQVQNCRFEAKEHATEHADCVQFQGAKIDGFRIDSCTLSSELQGTFMRVGTSAVDYAKNIDFRHLNYRGTGNNTFWQCWENNDSTSVFKSIVPVTLDDIWVAEDGDTSSVGMRCLPRADFTASPQAGGPRRGNFVAVDGTSQYCYFSDGTQTVPTGSAAGQQTLDCQITGIIRKGIPSGGDFVPGVAGTDLGINYVSPGYA